VRGHGLPIQMNEIKRTFMRLIIEGTCRLDAQGRSQAGDNYRRLTLPYSHDRGSPACVLIWCVTAWSACAELPDGIHPTLVRCPTELHDMNPGVLYAALAYIAWGLFPLYFHQLHNVGALEVVMHRTVWSLLFLLGVLLVLRRWAWLGAVFKAPRVLAAFALSASLLSVNWLTYVWAVQNHHVLDASLGYFILPLVNVAIGFFVLKERPRPWQWVAVAVAASGVLWLAIQAGHPPYTALALALTFGAYGLLRKLGALGALEGLTLETLILAPVAAVALAYQTWIGQSVFVQGDVGTVGWLLLAGPLTALPLLLFAAGARRITLTTMGILQYISPSLQFAVGVWLFQEPFASARFVGFVMIWAALVIYSVEGWLANRTR